MYINNKDIIEYYKNDVMSKKIYSWLYINIPFVKKSSEGRISWHINDIDNAIERKKNTRGEIREYVVKFINHMKERGNNDEQR